MMTSSILASPNQKSLVVGLCVTGSDTYWALALAMLVSVRENLDLVPRRILIATDQKERFVQFRQLQAIWGCEFVQVVPRLFYNDLVPKMKGNFATYWKFDLFNALADDEVLMYIDVDAFAIGKLQVSHIIELLHEGQFQLAAVPSLRPVLERAAATQIRNPFDYFNAGVLFGFKDTRYATLSLVAAYAAIAKLDTLNVFWHDQDMFNYLFRNDTLKLPYVYNVHTGFLLANFRSPYLVNVLASEDIDRNAKVAHVSGDFLLSHRYHPYKTKFADLIDVSLDIIASAGWLVSGDWEAIRVALLRLRGNATHTTVDYLLQCLGFRKRVFAAHFYLAALKSMLRKFKRFAMPLWRH